MSIFRMHNHVIEDYSSYIQSFLTIYDERINDFVRRKLIEEQDLWPPALLQLNPFYERSETIEEIIKQGKINERIGDFFESSSGKPFELYTHQIEAIDKALEGSSFVVTSGTGSGKSLTYLIPIFNAVLQNKPDEKKDRGIIVYPMNALGNS